MLATKNPTALTRGLAWRRAFAGAAGYCASKAFKSTQADTSNQDVPALWEAIVAHRSSLGRQEPLTVISRLNHIQKNLALEGALSERALNLKDPLPILFLWRNEKCVVIGRNQNVWSECNVERCKDEGVTIARRPTGGGAVYHDPGVSIFTFLQPGRRLDRKWGNQVIINALDRGYGLKTEASGRNDILIENRKFSGSAFKLANDMSVHHGTIMRSLDIGAMKNFLTPSRMKIEKNASTRSVQTPVANLCEFIPHIDANELDAHLQTSFLEAVTGKVYKMSELPRCLEIDESSAAIGDPIFVDTSALLMCPKWTYGITPPFETVFEGIYPWGCAEIRLQVQGGSIKGVQVFTDALDVAIPELLRGNLKRALNGSKFGDLSLSIMDSMCTFVGEKLSGKLPSNSVPTQPLNVAPIL